MAFESPVCAMKFDYRQTLDIEMSGGLNGTEIKKVSASNGAYLSAQICYSLPRMRGKGLRYLAEQPRRAVHGERRGAPHPGAGRVFEMHGLQNGVIPVQDN